MLTVCIFFVRRVASTTGGPSTVQHCYVVRPSGRGYGFNAALAVFESIDQLVLRHRYVSLKYYFRDIDAPLAFPVGCQEMLHRRSGLDVPHVVISDDGDYANTADASVGSESENGTVRTDDAGKESERRVAGVSGELSAPLIVVESERTKARTDSRDRDDKAVYVNVDDVFRESERPKMKDADDSSTTSSADGEKIRTTSETDTAEVIEEDAVYVNIDTSAPVAGSETRGQRADTGSKTGSDVPIAEVEQQKDSLPLTTDSTAGNESGDQNLVHADTQSNYPGTSVVESVAGTKESADSSYLQTTSVTNRLYKYADTSGHHHKIITRGENRSTEISNSAQIDVGEGITLSSSDTHSIPCASDASVKAVPLSAIENNSKFTEMTETLREERGNPNLPGSSSVDPLTGDLTGQVTEKDVKPHVSKLVSFYEGMSPNKSQVSEAHAKTDVSAAAKVNTSETQSKTRLAEDGNIHSNTHKSELNPKSESMCPERTEEGAHLEKSGSLHIHGEKANSKEVPTRARTTDFAASDTRRHVTFQEPLNEVYHKIKTFDFEKVGKRKVPSEMFSGDSKENRTVDADSEILTSVEQTSSTGDSVLAEPVEHTERDSSGNHSETGNVSENSEPQEEGKNLHVNVFDDSTKSLASEGGRLSNAKLKANDMDASFIVTPGASNLATIVEEKHYEGALDESPTDHATVRKEHLRRRSVENRRRHSDSALDAVSTDERTESDEQLTKAKQVDTMTPVFITFEEEESDSVDV